MEAKPEQFISVRILPDPSAFDPAAAVIGEPALPMRFTWHKRNIAVRHVISRWKEHDPDRTYGSDQFYLRRHWFEVEIDDGSIMKLHFQRQPGTGRSPKTRW
jgi:hypothetical protein